MANSKITDFSAMTAVQAAGADVLAIVDVGAGFVDAANRKITLTELATYISTNFPIAPVGWTTDLNFTGSNLTDILTKSHTVLSDIGANTHAQIDTHITAILGTDMIAGSGISGGGDLSANRTFNLDINGLAAAVVDPANDTIAFYDDGAGANKKVLVGNLPRGYNVTSMDVDATQIILHNNASSVHMTGTTVQTITSISNGSVDGQRLLLFVASLVTGKITFPTSIGNVDIDGDFVVTEESSCIYLEWIAGTTWRELFRHVAGATASGTDAIAFNKSTASGPDSFAANQGSTSAQDAAAFNNAVAGNANSFAVNDGVISGDDAFAANGGASEGLRSSSFGQGTAGGIDSLAGGESGEAIGDDTFAFGEAVRVELDDQAAFGRNHITTGYGVANGGVNHGAQSGLFGSSVNIGKSFAATFDGNTSIVITGSDETAWFPNSGFLIITSDGTDGGRAQIDTVAFGAGDTTITLGSMPPRTPGAGAVTIYSRLDLEGNILTGSNVFGANCNAEGRYNLVSGTGGISWGEYMRSHGHGQWSAGDPVGGDLAGRRNYVRIAQVKTNVVAVGAVDIDIDQPYDFFIPDESAMALTLTIHFVALGHTTNPMMMKRMFVVHRVGGSAPVVSALAVIGTDLDPGVLNPVVTIQNDGTSKINARLHLDSTPACRVQAIFEGSFIEYE